MSSYEAKPVVGASAGSCEVEASVGFCAEASVGFCVAAEEVA